MMASIYPIHAPIYVLSRQALTSTSIRRYGNEEEMTVRHWTQMLLADGCMDEQGRRGRDYV